MEIHKWRITAGSRHGINGTCWANSFVELMDTWVAPVQYLTTSGCIYNSEFSSSAVCANLLYEIIIARFVFGRDFDWTWRYYSPYWSIVNEFLCHCISGNTTLRGVAQGAKCHHKSMITRRYFLEYYPSYSSASFT
jgi:hypothetical protein